LKNVQIMKKMSFKKENKQQKTKRNEKKTAYLLLGCSPVGNAGRAGCAVTRSAPTSSVGSTSRQDGS
jgi:hypothetical protein